MRELKSKLRRFRFVYVYLSANYTLPRLKSKTLLLSVLAMMVLSMIVLAMRVGYRVGLSG